MTLGIICDVGGTLLLTDDVHRDAWREALGSVGLASERNVALTRSGLAQGLDSFAIAESLGIGSDRARDLALAKQRCAQIPRASAPNPATIEWLDGHTGSVLAAISHSDEIWTRAMLQRAGILERFVFVRGRTGGRRISKRALVGDSAAILRQWWGAERLVYCGDTGYDRGVAQELVLDFVHAGTL